MAPASHMTPDQRLYTLQLSRRDLGWILNAAELYQDHLKTGGYTACEEILALITWLWQIYDGAPDTPAYFWLGEEGERILL